MLFVIPESVTKEQRDRAASRTIPQIAVVTVRPDLAELDNPESSFDSLQFFKLLSPLAIFLPVPIFIDGSTRKRKDWSLTLLTCAMFGYMLSAVRVNILIIVPN